MTDREYTKSEKNKILEEVNEDRLIIQQQNDLEEKRIGHKKIYKIGSKKCYKFLEMERAYYLNIEDCKKISSKGRLIELYYKRLDEVKKKKYLIKTQIHSDKFFISDDPIRVYFKEYSLENDK